MVCKFWCCVILGDVEECASACNRTCGRTCIHRWDGDGQHVLYECMIYLIPKNTPCIFFRFIKQWKFSRLDSSLCRDKGEWGVLDLNTISKSPILLSRSFSTNQTGWNIFHLCHAHSFGETLPFTGPFNDVVTCRMRLTNPSDRQVCFKVKYTFAKLTNLSCLIWVTKFLECLLESFESLHKYCFQAGSEFRCYQVALHKRLIQ